MPDPRQSPYRENAAHLRHTWPLLGLVLWGDHGRETDLGSVSKPISLARHPLNSVQSCLLSFSLFKSSVAYLFVFSLCLFPRPQITKHLRKRGLRVSYISYCPLSRA